MSVALNNEELAVARERRSLLERIDPGKASWPTRFGLPLVVLSVLSGLATFVILTGLTSLQPSREIVILFLVLNGVLVALMALLIGWQVFGLLSARRQQLAGSGLHVRIVALLSLFAAVPALVVAVFATVTLNRGLDAWFSERTRNIVNRAESVAEAYIAEQGEVARGDIVFIAQDLSQQRDLFDNDRPTFIRRLATHAAFRSLSGAFVIDAAHKRVDASATANPQITFRPPDSAMLDTAKEGKLVLIGPADGGNVIRALIKLDNFPNHFLYVYRLVNPSVVEQLEKAREEKLEYDRLLNQRAGLQVTFALLYSGLACIFLLAAIWLGLWFANRLANPIARLVAAARQVSEGDLDAKVPVAPGTGDLATLTSTFNSMTSQLKSQHDDLMSANLLLDARRRFTEAVLAGVSAGVIGLDAATRITLANRSASQLLGINLERMTGQPFDNAVEPMAGVLRQAMAKLSGTAVGQVNMRVEGQERNFVVRVTTERSSEDEHGYVVTFDDITELVSAQRNSAWADIARRIAHEIKNPLTPIQLSAERLKRKYTAEIKSDPQIFEQCTSTIIRQVGDIGRMVDEFSAFARMPSAQLETEDLGEVVRQALVLQRVSASNIDYSTNLPEDGPMIGIDRRLVTQAVTNLVKNAGEAIEARLHGEPDGKGHIRVVIRELDDQVHVDVMDDGIGLPKENRSRLTEPYVTTREKGTGLGLAIVKRIMEEHGGRVTLGDAPDDFFGGKGALVRLIFPRDSGGSVAQAAEQVETVGA
jgi:two-component system nitrogen regulation sensor histidine kinase NtrY